MQNDNDAADVNQPCISADWCDDYSKTKLLIFEGKDRHKERVKTCSLGAE
jgi:hypothetical protein